MSSASKTPANHCAPSTRRTTSGWRSGDSSVAHDDEIGVTAFDPDPDGRQIGRTANTRRVRPRSIASAVHLQVTGLTNGHDPSPSGGVPCRMTSHNGHVTAVYVIRGAMVTSLEAFWAEMSEAVNGPGGYFGRNLDALDDCLGGGFGTPDD